MEYDSYRQVAWYWTFLFTAFGVTVIVLVLWNNPFLYDQVEFKTALSRKKNENAQPIPSVNKQIRVTMDRGEQGTDGFGGLTHSGIDTGVRAWSHNFYNVSAVPLPLKLSEDERLFFPNSELYVVNASSLRHVDAGGQKKWQFSFLKNPINESAPMVVGPTFDFAAAYVALNDGKLFSILRSTGELLWMNELGTKTLSAPFLIGEKIYVFASALEPLRARVKEKVGRGNKNEKDVPMKKMGLHLISVKRAHGEIDRIFPVTTELEEQNVEITLDDTAEILYVIQANKIFAYEFATMKSIWQATLPSAAMGAAVVEDENVYVATTGGQLLSYNAARGRKNWEVELEQPSVTLPFLIPSHNFVGVISATHVLTVMDARNGEKKWHFQLETDLQTPWAYSSRLNGTSITETKLKWIHKGWVLFAPCMKSRVCVFNPESGQVVGRLSLHGRPLLRPAVSEGKYLGFLTAGNEGDLKFETVIDKTSYQKWRVQHGKDLDPEPNEDSF